MEQNQVQKQHRGKLQQREKIVDAALSLFTRRGFNGLTLGEIAGKAGYGLALPNPADIKGSIKGWG